MKKKILASLKRRYLTEITSRISLKYLLKGKAEEYIDTVLATVYLYTRPKKGKKSTSIYFTEVACAIGHRVMARYKMKKDSALAVRTGSFLLYTFEELGILQVVMGAGNNGHQSYIIQVIDDEAISKLWNDIAKGGSTKLPLLEPAAPWTSTRHASGVLMIKTSDPDVLEKVTPENNPVIYNMLNKSQAIGWRVNEEVYRIYLWALKNKTEAFSDIWTQQNPEARKTKIREAKAIGDIAKRYIGKTFYHLYSLDFRGRKYTNTAYFHEQGSDLSRGLLLRDEKKPIGEGGFFWLLVSLASNWAGDSGLIKGGKTDKIPLQSRFDWVMENENLILEFAEDPRNNQGWMKADKPWQFLAACIELKNLRIWQSNYGASFTDYSYESHLEVFIDGTNNGSQHLSALTRDEVTAPHVNLVPSDLPGDLYMYVAQHVWSRIDAAVAQLDPIELHKINWYIDSLIELKKKIAEAEHGTEERKLRIDEIRAFKLKHKGLGDKSSAVFWSRIKCNKQRRKIVKRGVMVLPYGGTKYGLSQQVIDDSKKHGINLLLYLEHQWGSYLGGEIYEDCRVSLKRPMQLLELFEAAGRRAEIEGKFLSWTTPVTNFPVVQHYVEGTVKKIWCQYGSPKGGKQNTGYYENTFQLAVCFVETTTPSKGKQAQGASPNCIHSLDAAHLAMICDQADFGVTTVHDSFGCLLSDMPKLYKLTRSTFVELYEKDPLRSLMKDIGGDINDVQMGSLDITLIKDSEYCFS